MRVAGVTPSLHRTLILNYYFLFLVRTFCVLLSFSLKVREQERRIWLNREIALRTHARAISGGARIYNNLSANLPRPCPAHDEKCNPLRRECTKQCPSSRNMRPWSRTGTAALFESLTQNHTQEHLSLFQEHQGGASALSTLIVGCAPHCCPSRLLPRVPVWEPRCPSTRDIV